MHRLPPLLLLLLATAAAPAAPRTAWFRWVAADGSAIGWSSQETRPTPDGREIVAEQEMLLENDDRSTRLAQRSVTRQDRQGRTLSVLETEQTGRNWARTETRIEPGRALVTRTTRIDRRTLIVPLPPGVRTDNGAALLKGWDPAATPRLEFEQYSPGAASAEHVVIEALPSPGDTIQALRRRYERGELRGVARLTLGRDGRILSVTQPMFGTNVTNEATDRETALRRHAPYKVLANVMTKAPVRIPDAALQSHIRYRFGFRDGIDFPIPQTAEQRTARDGAGAVVDICAACGPGLPSDRASLAEALKPTAWMQSDDPRLKAIAAPVAKLKVSDARKMELLLERARPYLLTIDFTGHYSALETLSRRAGDCTEAAVLLAALGRAAGIPTRVANGMVYSRPRYHGKSNVFLPHSWTLAYVDGAWRSFDLALDTFDATHIALAVGDGDPGSLQAAGQLGSLLLWEGLSEIRKRPAA